jgi:hypothetical protein
MSEPEPCPLEESAGEPLAAAGDGVMEIDIETEEMTLWEELMLDDPASVAEKLSDAVTLSNDAVTALENLVLGEIEVDRVREGLAAVVKVARVDLVLAPDELGLMELEPLCVAELLDSTLIDCAPVAELSTLTDA